MATSGSVSQISDETSSSWHSKVTPRNVLLGILVGCLIISGYLSYVKLNGLPLTCIEGVFDCNLVQSSIYSELAGIPIAWLGLGLNIVLFMMLLFEERIEILSLYGPMLTFGLILFGFLFSVYLVYVQAFLLEAFCQWCLGHEALYTLLFGVSILHLRNAMTGQEE